MHGFKNVLIHWLKTVHPQRIIEWGPGLSTELMLEHAPQASIVTIEHDESYLAIAAQKYVGRVRLIHERATNRHSNYATAAYAHAPYDLAFVDGRRRVECVLVALQCLSPGGLVIIHDWCRVHYRAPLHAIAEVVETRANTAVLRPRALPLWSVPEGSV